MIEKKEIDWNVKHKKVVNKDDLFKHFNFNISDIKKTYDECKYDPLKMKDMDKSIKIIKNIKDTNKKIVIFGDYDTDGISGISTIYKGFLAFGIKEENIDYIVPNRDIGYSIQEEYIIKYLQSSKRKIKNIDFILTVDCGISSDKEIAKITKNLKIPVGVTDHHHCPKVLPKTSEFNINPSRLDCKYPFKAISGSMVGYKLIEAIYNKYGFENGNIDNLNECKDIATLGTIADMMPIKDENFFLTRESLNRYKSSKNKAINKMTALYGDDEGYNYKNTSLVGYKIGPMLNSAGRLASADIGVRLLLSNDNKEIATLIEDLNKLNEERKEKTVKAIDKAEYNNDNRGIIVEMKSVEEGLIGLISGRIKEKEQKPTVCMIKTENGYKMSGRSIGNVDILGIMQKLDKYFIGYGGHKGAFGGTIKLDVKEDFIKAFYKQCNKVVKDEDMVKKIEVLGFLPFTDSNYLQLTSLTLGPYGFHREEPLYVGKHNITKIDILKEKHTRISFRENGQFYNILFFNTLIDKTLEKQDVYFTYKLNRNYYNGNMKYQFMGIDYKMPKSQ